MIKSDTILFINSIINLISKLCTDGVNHILKFAPKDGGLTFLVLTYVLGEV